MTAEPAFRFHLPVRVRYHETDRQGHVNFIWHQSYFAMAMADYLKATGTSYSKLNENGIDMLFVDAHSSFHDACFYDEVLLVHCRVERIGTTSIRFAFETTAEADGRRVATGDLTVVLVDAAERRKRPVPDELRSAIAAFENASAK
ncbi:MAG TPA: thioesterase family protein [Anaerolineales bacterium]|nr:thioesterase family protein [Anaerolineales bacterium]